MSWPIVKLGDVVEILSGFAFKSANFNDNQGLPLIRIRDVVRGRSKTFYLGDYPEEYVVADGDLLIGMDGDFNREKWRGGRALLNQRVCKIVANGVSLDQQYLYHFLPKKLQRIHAATSAVTVKHLSVKGIRDIEIHIPSLPEQKRIAAILDKADALRRKRQLAIDLADQFLRSVFLDMFGDPVTNPKGWEMEELGKLSMIRRGASPRPIAQYLNGTVPWIKIGDGSKGNQLYLEQSAEHVTQAGADKSVYLEPGSLIFANCGVSLGFARILKIGGCIHDGWLSIAQLDEHVNKIYLLKWINHLTEYFRGIAPDGTQPNLNTGIMKSQKLMMPPIDLQNQFENIVHANERHLDKINESLNISNCFFHSLSQKAFAGEL